MILKVRLASERSPFGVLRCDSVGATQEGDRELKRWRVRRNYSHGSEVRAFARHKERAVSQLGPTHVSECG